MGIDLQCIIDQSYFVLIAYVHMFLCLEYNTEQYSDLISYFLLALGLCKLY